MIKQIWFDFGNIFIPIFPQHTKEQLKSCGLKLSEETFNSLSQQFEKGELTESEFFSSLVHNCTLLQATRRIKLAWNALLGELNDNVLFLQKLHHTYELCLVSNTNETHIDAIRKASGPFLWNQFVNAFDALFLSFEMGERKPDRSYFEYVLSHMNATPEEVLFIDDTAENLETAAAMGLHTLQFNIHHENLEAVLPSVLAKFDQTAASALRV